MGKYNGWVGMNPATSFRQSLNQAVIAENDTIRFDRRINVLWSQYRAKYITWRFGIDGRDSRNLVRLQFVCDLAPQVIYEVLQWPRWELKPERHDYLADAAGAGTGTAGAGAVGALLGAAGADPAGALTPLYC